MKKRSVKLKNHATSVTVEDEFWILLKQIAERNNISIATLINDIDEQRLESKSGGLSSAIRVYVLKKMIEKY
jgi:predicted DNA-binding ribbon-helix-helix protein